VATCLACGTSNRDARKFCSQCGAGLAVGCPSCGAANEPGERFCGECGAALGAAAPQAPAERPLAERRLVSVLFADLVGFTGLSESQDAEETRELLSQYFELARTLIGRYGGTVEKFIGDAVMAVWGAPVATESDAERAVRAALDLVAAVPELSAGLRARAGVLTGEAAVTLGAQGEGMVAGDLVNTAARVQSVASPGTVLVGAPTRSATDQAIVYHEAGVHELKGKSEPVPLWRAVRVVSGVGGGLKSVGLEAPFVARDRELKLIKELFHASAEQKRAHLVAVAGIAGIGKSRLMWEFYKYIDGLSDTVWWHRGRCLAYGEGVAYWALADMVRMRCRIAEDDPRETARLKLRSTLEEHFVEPRERAFAEPRLATLLGLEDGAQADRQDLFSAWRLFFERLSEELPTVLAFEDMQWADTSLLDFIEHLLEWSRDKPVYVLTLARPELQERRPGWGTGRNITSLYLDALSPAAMEELLDGLVPGLPSELRSQILTRAEGVPLYAVETVRMLLDRGLLAEEGAAYRPTGAIDRLEVPQTLHALIAARLDGLSAEERRLLQDGAVLGKTFTPTAIAALAGATPEQLEPVLAGLIRKEILGIQSDPRSPERGQYGFLQDLVRHVTYETIAKRDRKARHLAAAAHLASAFADQDEIAEVLASHYIAAYEAAPDADDAEEIRSRAGAMLAQAGGRAAALGALDEGQRYLEQAAAIVDDPEEQARLIQRVGRLALQADRIDDARAQLARAVALYEEAGARIGAAHARAELASAASSAGEWEPALELLERAVQELEEAGETAELADALAELGRTHAIMGDPVSAIPMLERALTLAERLQLPAVFVEALDTRALAILDQGRPAEARILLEAAAARAHAEELTTSALRAENNLGVVLEALDLYADAVDSYWRSLALARRRGDRRLESIAHTGAIAPLFLLGRWDEALAVVEEEEPRAVSETARLGLLHSTAIDIERGDLQRAEARLAGFAPFRDSERADARGWFAVVESRYLRSGGRPAEALARSEFALRDQGHLPLSDPALKSAMVEALEAALAIPDLDRAEALLETLAASSPGELTPLLRAQAARFRARVDDGRGRPERIDVQFRNAEALFREFGLVFQLALTQLEHGEWLNEVDRRTEAVPLLIEASETLESLQAQPTLARALAALDVSGAETAAPSL